MPQKKQKKYETKPVGWQKIAELTDEWRTAFDQKRLKEYALWWRDRLNPYSKKLAELERRTFRNFYTSAFESVFGTFDPHHSFRAPVLNWRMTLTEPIVTRTLATLLDSGYGEIRARRIRAFLVALCVPDIPDNKILQGCRIKAEMDRIDLEIWIPDKDSRKFLPVLIEAKFGHHLTKGQLKKYTDQRKNNPLLLTPPHCVLLGLTEKVKRGLKGKQNTCWKFVAWCDLWLRFEKLRPPEDDPNLTIFLHTLWHRIGALNQENNNAKF